MKRYIVLSSALVWSLIISMMPVVSAHAAPQATAEQVVRQLVARGAATFPPVGPIGSVPNGGIQTPEFPPSGVEGDVTAASVQQHLKQVVNRSHSRRPDPNEASVAASGPLPVPVVDSSMIAGRNPGLVKSFQGLNLFDQRYANNGNQFTVEPPDQALCAGNGFVLESVNTVLRVYSTAGTPASGVIDLNTFYGYPAIINRTTNTFGPFITDPSCYYDPEHQRFVHVALTLDVVPKTGEFTGRNHLDIAVSQTSSPLGDWNLYSLPVQNDGTERTPKHPGCPCIGDYPHIGADANGIYLTTNEYPFGDDPGVFGNNFNGAQLYAIPKAALANRALNVNVVQFENLRFANGIPGFTVWPAQSPDSKYATEHNGSEYFLSSVAAEEALNKTGRDNRIGLWAVRNTASLNTATPELRLVGDLLNSETYGVPPLSEQKLGNVPLRDCLVVGCLPGIGPSRTEVEGPIDSSDSRMQQVWFANGKVWGALDTIVNVGGNIKAGIAYFIVDPGTNVFTATIAKQGYVAVARNNVNYPAIAVLPNGQGIMAMSLVGKDYYPSAAYTPITQAGTRNIHIAGAGVGPQDGFSEYQFFAAPDSPPRPRWGDYSAAVTDGSTIWMGTEYIGQTCTFTQYQADPTCGKTRTALGNWATRVSAVQP